MHNTAPPRIFTIFGGVSIQNVEGTLYENVVFGRFRYLVWKDLDDPKILSRSFLDFDIFL